MATVTFSANGGTGTLAAETETVATALSLFSTGTIAHTGYTFSGWATTPTGTVAYADGASYPFTADATLYAVWAPIASVITYSGNGGTGTLANQNVTFADGSFASACLFINPGQNFVGWNTAANGSGTTFAGGSRVDSIVASSTFYAQWSASSVLTIN